MSFSPFCISEHILVLFPILKIALLFKLSRESSLYILDTIHFLKYVLRLFFP